MQPMIGLKEIRKKMYRVRAGDNARIKEEISVCKLRNTQMMR